MVDCNSSGAVACDAESVAALWQRWALLPWPVLLRGENGTGKTALARRLHELSGRRGPFVDFSMAQVPPNLEVAELCGYRRGAFTGADHDHPGIFENAHGGSAFLDEIGLALLAAQGVLLKILDTSSIKRLGENRVRKLDFRLIAATSADLEAMIARREFRQDLMGRFGFYVLYLLPLRQRRHEILPLARGFLEAASARIGRTGAPDWSVQARQHLLRAPWPHNVRDLENLCRYVAGCAGETIEVADLPGTFLATLGIEASRPDEPLALRLRQVLNVTGGNKAEAARRLGISRQYAHRLLKDGP